MHLVSLNFTIVHDRRSVFLNFHLGHTLAVALVRALFYMTWKFRIRNERIEFYHSGNIYLNFASIHGCLFLLDVQHKVLATFRKSFGRSTHFVLIPIVRIFANGSQTADLLALLRWNTFIKNNSLNSYSNLKQSKLNCLTDCLHDLVVIVVISDDQLEFAACFENHFE